MQSSCTAVGESHITYSTKEVTSARLTQDTLHLRQFVGRLQLIEYSQKRNSITVTPKSKISHRQGLSPQVIKKRWKEQRPMIYATLVQ